MLAGNQLKICVSASSELSTTLVFITNTLKKNMLTYLTLCINFTFYRAIQENKNIVVEKEVINRANQELLDWDYQLWHYIVLFMLALVLTSGLVYLKRCKRYVICILY